MGIEEHIGSLVAGSPEESADDVVEDPTLDDVPRITPEGDAPYQFEESGDEDTQSVKETPTEEQVIPPEIQAELDRIRAESGGRLSEITGLREKLRTQGDSIESMRQMMVEDAEIREREDEEAAMREEYGDEVLNDPAISLLTDRLDAMDDRAQKEREAREHRIQQINKVKADRDKRYREFQGLSQHIINTESKFKETHPTYDAAYDHLREQRARFYKARGYDAASAKNLVNQEEWYLVQESIQRGSNLAEDVWNMATEFGFDPASVGETARAQGRKHVPDAGRMQAGVRHSGISSAPSTAGRRPNVLTREQFFKEVPYGERMKILGDPGKFEQLTKTGEIEY